MSSILKNIFMVVALIVTAALGYYLYLQQGISLDVSETALATDAAAESAQFLRLLNELKAIELNGAIFSDARFSSLTDFSVPIQAEPIGRSNPFEVN